VESQNVIQESYSKNPKNAFKILIGLYKGNYIKFIGSTILFIIKHVPTSIMPIAIANIVNIAIDRPKNAENLIVINGTIMIALILQNLVSNYYHTRLHSIAIRSVESRLRSALIKKLQELSIPHQKDMASGALQSKIMRDVESVQTLSQQVFVGSLNMIINMATSLVITLLYSKTVFIFFLITVPVAAIIIVSFREKIKQSNSKFRREMEKTSAKVVEMIELVPIARAHALEAKEVKRLDYRFGQILEKGYRLDVIQSVFGSVSWAVFQIFQIICLMFTGYLAFKGRISSGEITMYQSYFATIVNSVSSLITLVPTITKGMESVTSIGEVLNAGEVERYDNKKKVKTVKGAFEFKNVSYSYPNTDNKVIDNFSLSIAEGESIAFVGESGSGKSTLLNIIIGFVKPDIGQVLLDGCDMADMDLRSYRNHIAVVPQNTILFAGSIRSNITYGLDSVSENQLKEVLIAANLWEVVNDLKDGLDTMVGEHGDKLSGGQKQRLSIARALIRNPKVIILDEATSALDTVSERKIQESLNRLCKGRTTFMVAHRLSTIRDADKIAVIEQGECVEFGSYEELMQKKGKFYKYKKLQS